MLCGLETAHNNFEMMQNCNNDLEIIHQENNPISLCEDDTIWCHFLPRNYQQQKNHPPIWNWSVVESFHVRYSVSHQLRILLYVHCIAVNIKHP